MAGGFRKTAVAALVGALLATAAAPAQADHRHRHGGWGHDGGYGRHHYDRYDRHRHDRYDRHRHHRRHDDSISGKDIAIGLGVAVGAGVLFSMLADGARSASPPPATSYGSPYGGTFGGGYGYGGGGPVDAVPTSETYLGAGGVPCRDFRDAASGAPGTACQRSDGSWVVAR